jgi:alpha-1,3-rhamnosyl/mannosyltransferase
VPSEKIFVTYEAASGDFREISDQQQIGVMREKYYLSEEYILALGSADPRKNIHTLLKAYALLPTSVRDRYQLVIVWNNGYLTSSIDQEVEAAELCDRVQFLEWVSNDDLVLLYNAAALFAFPSCYEGFGLPLLEAMACGTPIVAANNSSIPEIADKASLLTEADNAHAIAETISLALSDESLRADLIAKGFKRAAFFSWDKCALQTIDVYKQVLLTRQLTQTTIERSNA